LANPCGGGFSSFHCAGDSSFLGDPEDANRVLRSCVKAFAPCAGMALMAFACFSLPDWRLKAQFYGSEPLLSG